MFTLTIEDESGKKRGMQLDPETFDSSTPDQIAELVRLSIENWEVVPKP